MQMLLYGNTRTVPKPIYTESTTSPKCRNYDL